MRMCCRNIGVIFVKELVENFVKMRKKIAKVLQKKIMSVSEKIKANLVSKIWRNSKDSVSNKYCGNAAKIIYWKKNYEKIV